MASKIKVDQIEGSTGSTITIPTGQTLTVTDGLAIGSLPTVTVAKGGTNLTSFTAGDTLYATGSTTLAKLAKGSAADVLTMNSGATAPEWAAAAGGGKVGQVVSALKTDTFNTSSNTAVTTGLAVTITPTATSSKIMLFANLGAISNSTQNNRSYFKFNGGNTATYIGDAASGHECASADVTFRTDYDMHQVSMMYLDSPSTTSATTYTVYQWCDTGSTYLNGSPTVNNENGNAASTITAMEILA